MIKRIFNSQSKTVTFAALLLGISALISRLLGLLRDRLLAGTFGAGQELDIYFAAFRIPDFVYGILILGGVSLIFLPVFTEHFKKDEKQGWQLASNVLNCFLILLIVTCGILAILTPWLIKFVTPGFSAEQQDLAVSLTRIMFLSPIFFGLSSIFSGVLHYFNRFLAYALAPILYNLSIIFGILFFVPIFGLWGLAYGVVLGAFLHWLVQVPAARVSGFRYLPIFNFKSPGLKQIFKLMIPRMIGTAVSHINLIIITAIASTLIVGSISVFNFANNIQSFPIGIIGASFALASFPTLSRAWVDGQREKFLENFSFVFRQIFFLIVPISLLIFLMRAQLVRLILGTGNFTWQDTRLTAACLGIFCFGIFALSTFSFLNRVFYSFQDTKTPVSIAVFSLLLNIGLCYFFVWLLSFNNPFHSFIIDNLKLQGISGVAVVGLPLALSISGIVRFALLVLFLRKRLGHIRLREIKSSLGKVFLAAGLMAVVVYFSLQCLANFVDMNTFSGIFIQTALASLTGVIVYFTMTTVLKSPEIKIISSSVFKR